MTDAKAPTSASVGLNSAADMVKSGLRGLPQRSQGECEGNASLAIDRLRIELAISVHERQSCTAFGRLDLAIEAGMPSGVTGCAGLFDADPDRVLVAIGAHLDHALDVAGGFALPPQRLARPAVVPGFAGRN